jgi:DnaJ-class molecular chaperone
MSKEKKREEVKKTCPNCKGFGWISDLEHSECSYCSGSGYIVIEVKKYEE